MGAEISAFNLFEDYDIYIIPVIFIYVITIANAFIAHVIDFKNQLLFRSSFHLKDLYSKNSLHNTHTLRII